jgi:hypothetical protein
LPWRGVLLPRSANYFMKDYSLPYSVRMNARLFIHGLGGMSPKPNLHNQYLFIICTFLEYQNRGPQLSTLYDFLTGLSMVPTPTNILSGVKLARRWPSNTLRTSAFGLNLLEYTASSTRRAGAKFATARRRVKTHSSLLYPHLFI